MKPDYIDHSVYPDRAELLDLKQEFLDDVDRSDYVDRICGAWDFGVPPEPETFELFRQWKDVFDRFPLLHSPAYHAFRTIFRWEQLPRQGGTFIQLTHTPFDAAEGRTDPCEDRV